MADDLTKKIEAKGTSQKNKGSFYDTPKQDPMYAEKWAAPNLKDYKEAVYSKISELLLLNWDQIEPHISGNGLEALQKTYRDGKLKIGKNIDELMVVYQNDTDANSDDEKVENAILSWLNFIDVSQMTLKVIRTAEANEEGKPLPPNLILRAPGKEEFNLNEIIGTMELNEINLKDNISQFMKLDKVSTNINRNKLSEYVDTDFSELLPLTFTHLIEKFKKFKQQIPFRYRVEDFFEEYFNSNVSSNYRIEKLFEEFERIKVDIPKGNLAPQGSVEVTLDDIPNDDQLFGWKTLTHLVAESQDLIGTSNPIYSQNDARSWVTEIIKINSLLETYEIENRDLRNLTEILMKKLENIGTTEDMIEYEEEPLITPPIEPGVSIKIEGTGLNNQGPREFYINDTDVYLTLPNRRIETGNRKLYTSRAGKLGSYYSGLRMTILSAESLKGGTWNGNILFDNIYRTHLAVPRKEMAEAILGGDWKPNDLFVITSHRKIGFGPLLISALKSVGACYPRTVSGLGDTDTGKNERTPYALIGTTGLGECNGFENVQDDGPYSTPATITKFWIPDDKGEGGWDIEPPEPILGCADASATNYDSNATMDDGSCIYPPATKGCTDTSALNFDVIAEVDDGSCTYPAATRGCLDPIASNYNAGAEIDDGSCYYEGPPVVEGCTDETAENYDSDANEDDGSCKYGLFETSFEGGQSPCLPSLQLYGQSYPMNKTGAEINEYYENVDPVWGWYKGKSGGLNNILKYGKNPGDSVYVLEQDGKNSNECELIIEGLEPSTSYTLTAWVSYNNSYAGPEGAGIPGHIVVNSSKGKWSGGGTGDAAGILRETRVVGGDTWKKFTQQFNTSVNADMRTGKWHMGYTNAWGNNPNAPQEGKDCNTQNCEGRRYITGIKIQKTKWSDYPQGNVGGSAVTTTQTQAAADLAEDIRLNRKANTEAAAAAKAAAKEAATAAAIDLAEERKAIARASTAAKAAAAAAKAAAAAGKAAAEADQKDREDFIEEEILNIKFNRGEYRWTGSQLAGMPKHMIQEYIEKRLDNGSLQYRTGGLLQAGGPIKSIQYPDVSVNTNLDINTMLPRSQFGFDSNPTIPSKHIINPRKPITNRNKGSIERTRPVVKKTTAVPTISSQVYIDRKKPLQLADCKKERDMFNKVLTLSLEDMYLQLTQYARKNRPCLKAHPPVLQEGDLTPFHCDTVCGDTNEDGDVNVLDIVSLVNTILGDGEATDQQFACGDVNEDGELNILDVVTIVGSVLDTSNQLSCWEDNNGGDDCIDIGGTIGCDNECYPGSSIGNVPFSGQYNGFGHCNSNLPPNEPNYSACQDMCQWWSENQQIDPESFDYVVEYGGTDPCIGQQCYTNSVVDGYVVPIPIRTCTYSFGDGCMERGGIIKRGNR